MDSQALLQVWIKISNEVKLFFFFLGCKNAAIVQASFLFPHTITHTHKPRKPTPIHPLIMLSSFTDYADVVAQRAAVLTVIPVNLESVYSIISSPTATPMTITGLDFLVGEITPRLKPQLSSFFSHKT